MRPSVVYSWVPWVSCVLCVPWLLAGEPAPEQLPDVVVRETVADASMWEPNRATVVEALAPLPRLRLVLQGMGAQTDVSINASSFSGAGLSIAGLALRNPQTEHFHAELPLPPSLFLAPRVLTGLSQSQGSTGHLVGAVDLEPMPVTSGGAAEAGVGETGQDWQGLVWQESLAPFANDVHPGLRVFASREQAGGEDLPGNDLDRYTAGGGLQFLGPESQADLLLGHQSKTFGARGFYGAPASLPSQETLRDTLVLASWRLGDIDSGYTRATAAWRRTADTYLLDRDRPGLYRNQHASTVTSGAVDGLTPVASDVGLRWRVDAEEERLVSDYQGSIPSTSLGDHRRVRCGALLLPEWAGDVLTATAGGRAVLFSDDAPAWLPVAGVQSALGATHRLYLSYTETVRQPSYTELNYNSPSSLGNQGLERQHAATWELGCGGRPGPHWDWRGGAFQRCERDAVDWTKTGPGSPWRAVNLDRVNARGLNGELNWTPSARFRAGAGYEYCHKSADPEPWASRYVLDSPPHVLRFSVGWMPLAWCELRTSQSVFRYPPNAMRTSGRTAVDGTVEVVLRRPRMPGAELLLGMSNVWGQDVEVVPGQPPAGRHGYLAVRYAW